MNPSHVDVDENAPAEVECFSPSSQATSITWTRLDRPMSPYVEIRDGILSFPYVRREDVGNYQCSARNDYGDDTRVLHVYVRESSPPTISPIPIRELNISPANFNGREGDVVVLTCSNSNNAYAVIEWNKEGNNVLPSHIDVRNGVLTIYSAVPLDTGRYVCTQPADPNQNPEYADISIHPSSGNSIDGSEPPRVERLDDLYNVTQGTDFTLVCKASGNPYPRVEWKKLHDEIDNNVQLNGNILKITNAQSNNRGLYVCTAESNGQIAEASTVIEIDRK